MRFILKYRYYFIGCLLVVLTVGGLGFHYLKKIDSIKPQVKLPSSGTVSSTRTQAVTTGPTGSSGSQTQIASVTTNDQKLNLNIPEKKVFSVPILYYHSILSEPGNELRMPPEQFEAQMKYLAENGYHVITPDQLYNDLFSNGVLPPKPVLITFDDGYVDNYTNAYPILQKYGFVATVFMISSAINNNGYLTSDQLLALQASGWTIGGHTVEHTDLSKVKGDAIVHELQGSRQQLENLLGKPLKYFAYPFGGFSPDAVNKVKQDGYLMAVTTQKGWAASGQNPLLVKRVYCYANMGMKEFVRRISNSNY